jgi:steroid delta-isomerase-like uncharacterized protein
LFGGLRGATAGRKLAPRDSVPAGRGRPTGGALIFEANIGAVQRILEEAWSRGNLDPIDELVAEDYLGHDPVLGDSDREALKKRIRSYRTSFPDLTFEIDEIFEAGDKVVTRWRATGTFEREFMGMEPTREQGPPVTGISIDRFEEGYVVESWGEWNALQLMQNIGALPEGATARAD